MNSVSSRWLAGTAAAIVALIVAGVAAALIAGGPAETLPEDSPERVVQQYLQALDNDDYRAAYAYFGGSLQQSCSLHDFRQRMRWRAGQSDRVVLEQTEEIDGRAIVSVRVSSVSLDAPFAFAPNETSFRMEFALEREEGAWRFIEPPWPLGYCEPAPTPPDEASVNELPAKA